MSVQAPWIPRTEDEKDQVRRQMERLLATAHFKNSRRYPALFRFIVEETLEGRGEFLKERLLGVRVFQREPDYDTADDPMDPKGLEELRKKIGPGFRDRDFEAVLGTDGVNGVPGAAQILAAEVW